MLGRFLELSLVVPDSGAAWQRWLTLGFAAAEAGDIWTHPYGVVACEGLAVGLHAAGEEALCLTFVRPEVATLERELADRLIGIERAQLGSEAFNLLELREPGGTLLRVQESRTFSPPAEMPQVTTAGVFRALSLPCPDLAEARGFWERLGLEVRDISEPWEAIEIQSLPIACHEQSACRDLLLVFDAAGAPDDDAPRMAGLATGTVAALRGRRHRLLRTPDGVSLLEVATS